MSDLVRIFSLHGGEMSPKTKLIDQRRRDVSGAVIRLQPWDAERAAKELDGRVRETTIITASDVPHTGDFLDRIERATPRHIYVGDNKKAVKLGHTLVRVTSLPLQKLLDRKSGKLRQLFERLIGLRKHAASPTRSYPVVLDRFVRPDICAANSWERMKRITAGNQGTEGTFAVPVPWERLRGNTAGRGLRFSFCATFHRGVWTGTRAHCATAMFGRFSVRPAQTVASQHAGSSGSVISRPMLCGHWQTISRYSSACFYSPPSRRASPEGSQ